jgi:glycosyltransferase involved in cell wall biosynthesis
VGRLVPIKGYDLLVRAAGRLPPARRPALLVLGDGAEREPLLRLAAGRGVDLRLPGAVPLEEVAAHLGAADVFAHPARVLPGGRTEGMPVAVGEAIAAGLPVVAAACGGLCELAGTAGVRLVPPDDVGALARALEVALDLRHPPDLRTPLRRD